MLKSIIGTKVGMTQIFDAKGNIVPVTVVSAGPCLVTEVRTKERDGYTAVQLGFGDVKEKALTKPELGQFKKRNLALKRVLKEFRVADTAGFEVGQELKADIFKEGDYVDVAATSKGKGFAGAVKRHNFRGGPTTHGQSDRLRAPGSSGSQGPQRVLKGSRRPGHMGDELITVQHMRVVSVDPVKNFILLNGSVPGANKGVVVINGTVKKLKHVAAPKVVASDKKKVVIKKK
jgi:large subunit ribosomal protein L3